MKIRLYCVCGLSELLTCAYLKSAMFQNEPGRDIVLLYGMPVSMPPRLKRETLDLASLFAPWDEILDFTAETAALGERGWPDSDPAFDALAAVFAPEDVSHLVIHSIYKQPEYSLLDRFHQAELLVYDNGLVSYLPPKKLFPPNAPVRAEVRAADEERMAGVCFSLSDVLGLPDYAREKPRIDISAAEYRNLLDAVGRKGLYQHFTDRLKGAPDRASLVLGTPFHRSARVSVEEETAVYRRVVKAIAPSEDHAVFYKNHPRARHELDVRSPYLFGVETVAPIEFLAMLFQIKACYSVSSTSLLLMKKFFGIDSFVIGPEIGRKMNQAHIDLLYRHVPVWNGGETRG